MRYLILAQSECTASALGAWVELIGETAPKNEDDAWIVWNEATANGEEKWVMAYERLVKRIESAASMTDGSIALNDVVLLVDAVNPDNMGAIGPGGWDHLVGMLVLTFPEIRWVFGLIHNCKDEEFQKDDHTLMSLLTKQRRDPLLDATKLREWVKLQSSKNDNDGKRFLTLPKREHLAAAIDEEKSYAYFHAYTAWRYGFRADAITSWALMKQQFGNAKEHDYKLLLEDMNLNFPDKDGSIHLSDLEVRGEKDRCESLDSMGDFETSSHRLLITTGRDRQNGALLQRNESYLKEKSRKHGRGAVIPKPVGGMMDLWDKAKLFSYLKGVSRAGNADGFIWPPTFDERDEQDGASHSAPGKIMLIAETLLRRAETFRDSACTVKDFIKGAVLATEAAELLGGRTPTLTLAALALKHEYEVKAECAFVGVGYHFDVKGRSREIADEVRAVAQWFGKNRLLTEWDARVVIMNRLAIVFRDAGQFEEEQHALVEVRRLHRRLTGEDAKSPLERVVHHLLSYAEWLLENPARSFGVIAMWITTLSYMWYALAPTEGGRKAVKDTVSAFLGGNAIDTSMALLALSCFTVAAGVFHIGVFISYLYSLISRK